MMHDVRLNATLSAKYAITTFGQDVSKYLRLRREALNKSLSKVSAIIVPSQFLSDVMCKVFSCKCRVISHGIRSFEKQPRRDHSVNFVFGYVGNLIPSKGWRLLLEAFPEVRAAYPQSELHYFGAGSHKSKSIEGVVYHGEYDQEQLPHIFSEIDVVIIPSVVAEAFCLTLSEAWMAGCAVAVSDIGALGERVIDRVNGKKFKAGNVESIRNALRWFLENDCWKRWDIEQPKSLGEMLLEYDGLYQEFLKWKAGTIRS
jgi:glycosyltransferase involved in cell wall biosynthesis